MRSTLALFVGCGNGTANPLLTSATHAAQVQCTYKSPLCLRVLALLLETQRFVFLLPLHNHQPARLTYAGPVFVDKSLMY